MRRWTIGRASGLGLVAGLAALALWPAFSLWPELQGVYAAALVVALFCGASILWITAADMIWHRPRGSALRPVRGFDILLALLLVVPAALGLDAIL